jgi:hypothetical protein
MAIDNQKNGNAPIKGLKGINRFSNGATQQDIDNMRARLQAGAKQKLGHTQFTPSNSVTVPMASQVRGFGDSTYDTVMWNMNERDIQNQRADEQSWITQIANGTGKSLVLAGTTFVSGTVGTAFGIVNYLGRGIGEGDWNGKNFWDNPINKWMYNISKESEKWMPNYQDTEAQSRPWYKNVFTNNFGNFLGDSVIKNLGFSIGAYYGHKLLELYLRLQRWELWQTMLLKLLEVQHSLVWVKALLKLSMVLMNLLNRIELFLIKTLLKSLDILSLMSSR